MTLDPNNPKDNCGYSLIERAACILNACGEKQSAKDIHQIATCRGYDYYFVLRILKQYMEI